MTEDNTLVMHARDELERIGQFREDPEFAESIVEAVRAFTNYGHSGGSASVAIPMLYELLQCKPLGPLTDDPEEWMDVSDYSGGRALLQSRRHSAAFSTDGGKTFYDIDERASWWRLLAARVWRAPKGDAWFWQPKHETVRS